MAKSKVLIIGATGFAGSHVLESLMHDGSLEVVAACRNPGRLLGKFSGETRTGDVQDERYLEHLFDDIDIVCNAFAWTSLYKHSESSEELFLRPSLKLIDQAKKAGVRRIINLSTTSAASPDASRDAMSKGIERDYWPHLCNVVRIEDHMRSLAEPTFEVINLRVGLFAGRRYALGLLPILLPRLKTHLVPWVAGGRTSMPIIDGRDIGQAFHKAVIAESDGDYRSFNIVGPEVPTVREVIEYLHDKGYPKPHFGVPFPLAFAFAWLMELIDPVVPWEPLVTRSIIHLLREVDADNRLASSELGYSPEIHWQDAIDAQIRELTVRQTKPMKMAMPISG